MRLTESAPPRPCPYEESSCHFRHRVVGNAHRDELRYMVRIRVQNGRSWGECIRVFGAQHLYHPLPGLGAQLRRL